MHVKPSLFSAATAEERRASTRAVPALSLYLLKDGHVYLRFSKVVHVHTTRSGFNHAIFQQFPENIYGVLL